jgi:hypothetical protein
MVRNRTVATSGRREGEGLSARRSGAFVSALYLFILRIGLSENRFALFGPML